MKRILDLVLAMVATIILATPLLLVALAVKLSSPGPVLYWSDRVGRHNRIFRMPKFRSMRENTPAVATHLLTNPSAYLTPIGSFLRKSSLDELPQLWSILTGEMSFVGPRPALFNQDDLVALRTAAGVHELLPGLTGWAQVNGLRGSDSSLEKRIEYDIYYIEHWSIIFDLKIIIIPTTITQVLVGILS